MDQAGGGKDVVDERKVMFEGLDNIPALTKLLNEAFNFVDDKGKKAEVTEKNIERAIREHKCDAAANYNEYSTVELHIVLVLTMWGKNPQSIADLKILNGRDSNTIKECVKDLRGHKKLDYSLPKKQEMPTTYDFAARTKWIINQLSDEELEKCISCIPKNAVPGSAREELKKKYTWVRYRGERTYPISRRFLKDFRTKYLAGAKLRQN